MPSRRLSIHLAPHIFEVLNAKALREGRSSANLAAFLLERELRPSRPKRPQPEPRCVASDS